MTCANMTRRVLKTGHQGRTDIAAFCDHVQVRSFCLGTTMAYKKSTHEKVGNVVLHVLTRQRE